MKLKHYCPYCRNGFYFSKFRLRADSDIHVCPFWGLNIKLEHNRVVHWVLKLFSFIAIPYFMIFGWPTILIPYKPAILFFCFALVVAEYLTSYFVAIE
jgi:hypothetical protein